MNRRLTRERSSLHNKKSVSAKSDRAEGATHGDGTTGVNEEQFQIRYIDLVRVIDLNDVKRFKQLAANVDLNEIQLGNKPFLFHAILKNDSELVEFLLDEEIELTTKYEIQIDSGEGPPREVEATTESRLVEPLEYAQLLKRTHIVKLIRRKMSSPTLEQRWLKCLETLDLEQIDEFRKKFKNSPHSHDLLELGLIKASDMGSNKLIDYFLSLKVDVNCLCTYNGTKVTPLLQAIANKKRECAKYLIFRKADIHKKGEFGDALVTSVHYESPNDLITTILEKGASLASRHRDWPNLNLREYCVQFNKVQAKSAIDAFVFRLIASGEYEKLKGLYENGYISINVTNRFRKTGRDLAIERCHYNIVQLIDKIEERERRIKTKMGY